MTDITKNALRDIVDKKEILDGLALILREAGVKSVHAIRADGVFPGDKKYTKEEWALYAINNQIQEAGIYGADKYVCSVNKKIVPAMMKATINGNTDIISVHAIKSKETDKWNVYKIEEQK